MKLQIPNIKVKDIIFVSFPHDDSNQRDMRPAVVLKKFNNGMKIAKITSSSKDLDYKYQIKDTKIAGLNKDSYVRCDKTYTIYQNDKFNHNITKYGTMSDKDFNQVNQMNKNYQAIRDNRVISKTEQEDSITEYCNSKSGRLIPSKDIDYEK